MAEELSKSTGGYKGSGNSFVAMNSQPYADRCEYWHWDEDNIISKELLTQTQRNREINTYSQSRSLI